MKKIITLIVLLLIAGVGNTQEKEKRIKFNQGTLKICSNSQMNIKGYDGDEVIIKSLNRTGLSYFNYKDKDKNKEKNKNKKGENDTVLVRGYTILSSNFRDTDLEKGLKPLGNKSVSPEDNLYLDITENPGELIIKDYGYNTSNKNKLDGYSVQFKSKKNDELINKSSAKLTSFFSANNKYEILIPNSIKLLWNVEDCSKKNSNTFLIRTNSKPWTLSDFKGEVEISTSYKSISLTDVGGPVIANTIGGNITVIFDTIKPTNLYSLVSNDGYIDVSLSSDANVKVDVNGKRILSDIEFKVINETVSEGTKNMKLQLNSGKTKMKLDAGSGSVYLRSNE